MAGTLRGMDGAQWLAAARSGACRGKVRLDPAELRR
jgi:hypothetical protein